MSREPIRKLPSDRQGRVRYRAVVDAGRDAGSGRRKQLTRTFFTVRDARAWVAATRTDVRRGVHVQPHIVTAAGYVLAWLEGRRDLKQATRENYALALRPVSASVGARPLQALAKADLDRMVSAMLDGSLRSIGRPGQPLSARSVRLSLGVLSQALDAAVREGQLHRNVAALVERPWEVVERRIVWEATDTAKFIELADADRLAGAWRLSLHGLRRGEVLAVRWSDVDLEDGTVTVRRSRVAVAGGSLVQESTKTAAGARTVPLSPDAVSVLRTHRAQQREERLAAGVPVPVVAQVMGHASPAITMSVYAHALRTGADERVRAATSAAGL